MACYDNLKAVPVQVRKAFDAESERCFFSSVNWYQTFAQHALDPGDRVRIYCLLDERKTARTILPAVVRSTDQSFWKPRKLSSLSSYYTCLYGLIGDGTGDVHTAEELARLLAHESPRWDALELKPLDSAHPSFEILRESLRKAGFLVQTFFCFGNWYLDVQGRSFADYRQSLPSRLQHTLERKRRQVARSKRASVSIVSSEEGLEEAIAAYNAVYLASWKQPEPYPNFVPSLIRMCASQGTLRLGILAVDGRPAAAQLWIVHNGQALIYKLAYDEQFSSLSPGTILTAALMEHVMDVDRVRQVDYLSGDDAYKQDWMSARRERWGILAMNPRTVRGLLSIARHAGGRAIKRAVMTIMGRNATRGSSAEANKRRRSELR